MDRSAAVFASNREAEVSASRPVRNLSVGVYVDRLPARASKQAFTPQARDGSDNSLNVSALGTGHQIARMKSGMKPSVFGETGSERL